jgi:hypothetical protein
MTDQEFAKSNKVEKTPRVFALKKEGKPINYWEMDVSFSFNHHPGLLCLTILYRTRHAMCVRIHPLITDLGLTESYAQLFQRGMMGYSEIQGLSAALHCEQ